MRVIDELACSAVIIEQNIKTRRIELGFDSLADLLQGLAQCSDYVSWHFRKSGVMSLGDYQGVSLAHRINVQECEDDIGFENFC